MNVGQAFFVKKDDRIQLITFMKSLVKLKVFNDRLPSLSPTFIVGAEPILSLKKRNMHLQHII